MADTQAYYSGLLVTIDTQITALVTNQQVNYSIGNISVSAGDKLEQLRKLRLDIVAKLNALPVESIETIQDDQTIFGEDITRYHNEGD